RHLLSVHVSLPISLSPSLTSDSATSRVSSSPLSGPFLCAICGPMTPLSLPFELSSGCRLGQQSHPHTDNLNRIRASPMWAHRDDCRPGPWSAVKAVH